MRLKDNYYKLKSSCTENGTAVFRISLLKDCDVYRGHFPGNPVCPGVFNIQMLKELAEAAVGRKLHISAVRQCRFLAVATPAACQELTVRMQSAPVEGGCEVAAAIQDDNKKYVDFKGTLDYD